VIRRAFRRGLTLGLLGGAVLTAVKTFQGRRTPVPAGAPPSWDPIPDTTPVTVPEPAPRPDRVPKAEAVNALQEAPVAAKKKPKKKPEWKPAAPWVEPLDGACPTTHPVKGKLTSRIFHVPGGFSYPRTIPDRCYLDAAAAEADGLRASKR